MKLKKDVGDYLFLTEADDFLITYDVLVAALLKQEDGALKTTLLGKILTYLACHCLELTLKAFLRYKGYISSDLIKIGHNLNKLAKRVEKLGLNCITKGDREIINKYSKDYNEKFFEYPFEGVFLISNGADMREVAKKTLEFVRETFRDSDERKLKEALKKEKEVYKRLGLRWPSGVKIKSRKTN